MHAAGENAGSERLLLLVQDNTSYLILALDGFIARLRRAFREVLLVAQAL